MTQVRNPIVLIPARLQSTRLPAKPLADIHGLPMIVHCLRRAEAADVGPVVVACAEAAILDAVESAGGRAVLTRADHPSGSDRIFEALTKIDPDGRHDVVVNLQGDLPTLEPEVVRAVLEPLADPLVDIATPVVAIDDADERRNPNVVKAVVSFAGGDRIARALYFSRSSVPWPGEGDDLPLYHHIGLYTYRRAALERFVSLPPAAIEQRERLEQLRALADGMRIEAVRVDTLPIGVDTPADLARARELLAPRAS
jgi:3-deoxy-manno-octulosonate cytidylyltransferase (CMP-KDO synthetase)